MQEAAASRAARAPFVAHLCILELTGDSPIRVEPVSEDRVQDWRPPAPGVGGLPAVGGGPQGPGPGWLASSSCMLPCPSSAPADPLPCEHTDAWVTEQF